MLLLPETHIREEARDRFRFFCSDRLGIEWGWGKVTGSL